MNRSRIEQVTGEVEAEGSSNLSPSLESGITADSLKSLFQRYEEFNEDRTDGYIIHTDCLSDLMDLFDTQ